jgi:hypothetical protein
MGAEEVVGGIWLFLFENIYANVLTQHHFPSRAEMRNVWQACLIIRHQIGLLIMALSFTILAVPQGIEP